MAAIISEPHVGNYQAGWFSEAGVTVYRMAAFSSRPCPPLLDRSSDPVVSPASSLHLCGIC